MMIGCQDTTEELDSLQITSVSGKHSFNIEHTFAGHGEYNVTCR